MIKKTYTWVFVVLIFTIKPVYSQKIEKIDSLRLVINKLNKFPTTFVIDSLKVKAYYELSNKYLEKGLADSINNIGKRIFNISEKYSWKRGFMLSKDCLGMASKMNGDFYAATQYFLEALYIAEKQKFELSIGDYLYEIGNCYFLLKDYSVAISYYYKAIPIYKKLDIYRLATCYNNLGLSYKDLSQEQNAINNFEKGLEIYKKKHSNWGIINAIENIGVVYLENNQLENAEKYLTKAKLGIDTLGSNYFKANVLAELGELYSKKKKYVYSNQLCTSGLSVAYLNHYDHLLLAIYQTQHRNYKKLGNFFKASAITDSLMKIKEKLNKYDVDKRIKSLSFEYENKKYAETNLLQEKIIEVQEKTNRYLILGLIILIILGIILFYSNRLIKTQKNEIFTTKLELENLNRELENKVYERTADLSNANKELIRKNKEINEALVKGQKIERRRVADELHDNLGGQITAIRWSLMSINTENLTTQEMKVYNNVTSMLNRAYEEVRYISHNLLPNDFETLRLDGTLTNLVKQLNQSDKIRFIYDNNNFNELDIDVEFELYSIILELVNNIIKHSKATEAHIVLCTDNNDTFCKVLDNGLHFDIDSVKRGKGLNTIQQRTDTIRGILEYVVTESENFQFKGFQIHIPIII